MATATVEIARPPDEVFAFIADVAHLSEWQDVQAVEQLTPGPVGAGTRFRETHKAMSKERVQVTEVTDFEPGRVFGIRMVDGPPVDGRWMFEPAGAGTRLTFTPIARFAGRKAALNGVAERAVALGFRRHHRRLKAALER